MKKSIVALVFLSVIAFAADYSAMSATELNAMRGTVPLEDRPAFQAAMQEKMRTMTQEERQTFTQTRSANPTTGKMGANASSGRGGNGGGNGGNGGNGGGGRGGK